MTATTVTIFGLASDTLTGALAVVVALLLLASLMLKELVSSVKDSRTWKYHKALNFALVPLLIIFGFLAASTVMEALR